LINLGTQRNRARTILGLSALGSAYESDGPGCRRSAAGPAKDVRRRRGRRGEDDCLGSRRRSRHLRPRRRTAHRGRLLKSYGMPWIHMPMSNRPPTDAVFALMTKTGDAQCRSAYVGSKRKNPHVWTADRGRHRRRTPARNCPRMPLFRPRPVRGRADTRCDVHRSFCPNGGSGQRSALHE